MKTIKLTEEQQSRLLKNANNLREICNDIRETCPLEYHKIVDLLGLDYFIRDLFGLELPKCKHGYEDTYSDYKFKRENKNESK
jgi:hypothetical protein